MIGGGRVTGLVMMIGSLVLILAFLGWGVSALAGGETTGPGLVLGLFLGLLVLTPVFGVGFYLFRKGKSEESQFEFVKQEKKILNMVLTQGQVTVGELVAELELPRENVEEMIRDLVGKQLFSGAINWEKGLLYSVESQQLTGNRQCPNCGGELEFAGKGLIACPWCGSEVFLTKRAAAGTAAQSQPVGG